MTGESKETERREGKTEMHEPLLTIIVPAYNAARYLPACIESLRTQKLREPGDLEILVIDDGSTDATAGILRTEAAKDQRLHVLQQKHAGPGAARNLGLRTAKGRYVAFLDSDDALTTDEAAAFLVRQMETRQLDILLFGAEVTFETAELQERRYREVQGFHYRKAYGSYEAGRELLAELMLSGDFIPSACLMCFRRSFLQEHAITFPERLRCEDEVFCIAALRQAGRVCHTDRGLYLRRVREGSLMATATAFSYIRDAAAAWRDLLPMAQAETGRTASALRMHLRRRAQEIGRRYDGLGEEGQAALAGLSELEQGYIRLLLELAPLFRQLSASYLFPYHLFRRGERVVIYGAGNVGKDFVRQLAEQTYVTLVAVADKRWQTTKIPGTTVLAPEALKDLACDAILISVQDEALAKSVRTDLAALGIPAEKLRWDGPHYLKKDFYEGWYFPMLDQKRKENL